MNQLGVSTRDRVISRIAFYLVVAGLMWLSGRVQYDALEAGRERMALPGVPTPLIAVPVSDLEGIPLSR